MFTSLFNCLRGSGFEQSSILTSKLASFRKKGRMSFRLSLLHNKQLVMQVAACWSRVWIVREAGGLQVFRRSSIAYIERLQATLILRQLSISCPTGALAYIFTTTSNAPKRLPLFIVTLNTVKYNQNKAAYLFFFLSITYFRSFFFANQQHYSLYQAIMFLMPYLFSVEAKKSTIADTGMGLFAAVDIPAGVTIAVFSHQNPAPVYGFEALPNRILTKEELQAIAEASPEAARMILHGGFYYSDSDVFVEMRDGTQFLNHLQDNNIVVVYPETRDFRQLSAITTRPIKKGEEIFDDYTKFFSEDSEWVTELMKKYCPERLEFQQTLNKQK